MLIGQTIFYRSEPINLVGNRMSLSGLSDYMRSQLKVGCEGEYGLDQLVRPDRFFSMKSILCKDGAPIFEIDGTLLNIDGLHFNGHGSLWVAKQLVPWLKRRGLVTRPLDAKSGFEGA